MFRVAYGIVFVLLRCSRETTQLDIEHLSRAARVTSLRLASAQYSPIKRTHDHEKDGGLRLQAAAHTSLANRGADLRTRAVALLVLKRTDAAIDALQMQLAKEPQTAATWNDLAAALDERGRATDDTRTFAEALAAADHALRLDPQLAAAKFNRAALLETLGWREAAAQAWQNYLDRHHEAGWNAEARAHLAALRTPTTFRQWPKLRAALEFAALAGNHEEVIRVVRAFSQQARTTAEALYLSDWGEAVLSGNAENAGRSMTIASEVGRALVKISNDQLLDASVHAASARPSILAKAYVQYREARLLIRDRKLSQALPSIARAEETFRRGNSPMELVARYYRAGVLFDLNRMAEGWALLDSFEQHDLTAYPALHAQVLWERSLRTLRRGNIYASLPANERALSLFERLGERDNQIRLLSNRIATLTSLAREAEAWQLRSRLFRLAGASGNPDSVEATLHGSGFAAVQEKRFDIAHSLFTVLLASSQQSPVRRFNVACLRTLAAIRMGFATPEEFRDLKCSAEALPDEELRKDALDDLNYAVALFERDTNPAAAIEKLTRSIVWREQKQALNIAETYAARGGAYRALGNTRAGIADLEHALLLYETQRAAIGETDIRDSFFSWANTTCETLFALYMRERRYEPALMTAERCRARALADAFVRGGNAAPATFSRIRQALRDSTVLLHYNVLQDHTVVFVITRDEVRTEILSASHDAVETTVASLLRASERDESSMSEAVIRLDGLLLAPLREHLAPRKEIIIVPDDAVAAVPFAALRPAHGKYLLEEHDVIVVPSASSYVESGTAQPVERKRVAIVADPAFDRNIVGNLERLPGARREAESLARLDGGATLLVDRDATPARFLRALAESDVLYVASHAFVNTRDASLSVLVLAPSGDDGLLRLSTISKQRLRHRPLVVLGGCRTAVPGGGKGSIRSLALAFLAAGSRGVVGTLWDVEDESTYALLTDFQRRMRDGASPAAALREAQLQMLRSSNGSFRQIRAWGAFQFNGFE